MLKLTRWYISRRRQVVPAWMAIAFLISRVREEWVRRRDASAAVGDGIAFTGKVISATAAIMACVFLSFMLGDERTIKEIGFGLAAAVFLARSSAAA